MNPHHTRAFAFSFVLLSALLAPALARAASVQAVQVGEDRAPSQRPREHNMPIPPRVLAPSRDGAANVTTPTIRWTAGDGALAYRVRVYTDAALTQLFEEQRVVGRTETAVTEQLTDGGVYWAQVVAEYGTWSSPSAASRFKVIAMPSWMPPLELEAHDPARSIGGYKLVDLLQSGLIQGTPTIPAMILINAAGEIVWYHRNPMPGVLIAPKVLPNGNLLYAEHADGPGYVLGLGFEIDWNGIVRWFSDEQRTLHHDIGIGPGDDYLALEWLWKEHNGATLEGDGVVIMDRFSGQVVWEWSIFDHFDPDLWPTKEMSSPGISGRGHGDWTHANAITWDQTRSIIWVSVRHFDNLVGIDYPSGKVRVIVGKGGLGGEGLMSHQHAPEIQPDGKILLFDNGNTRTPPLTRVALIEFDELSASARVVWEWDDGFYDPVVGDANRLPNGNVLVTAGASRRVIEVTDGGDIVWEVRIATPVWRAYRTEYVPLSSIPAAVLPFGK